jgi:phosphatidylinositol-3-phosphatase
MTAPPRPGLILVIMENQQALNVLGNQNAPNLTKLSQTYPIATRYFATTHPSLPNYLTLWAGSTFGVTDDGLPAAHRLTGDALGSQLDAIGVSWAGYFGSLAAGQAPTMDSGPLDPSGDHLYCAHHNPIVYFEGYDAARVKPLSELLADLGSSSPPDFSLVVPSMADNMHDPVGSMAADSVAVQAGDRWFRAFLDGVTSSAWWGGGGTVLLTWDEAYNGSGQTLPGGIGTPPTNGARSS